MKYALGNMLSGGGALNPDEVSLDLAFAADKTLTARRGPTPTFARASTGTFVGSNGLIQSAAINGPRFDHDPVTGICRGLLIEEQRTNATVQSNGFSSSPWGENSGVVTLNQNQTGPDGITNSAWTFTDDSTLNPEGRFQSRSLTGGLTHTISAFVRKTTGTPTNFPSLSAVQGAAQASGVVINTTTGAVIPITSYLSTTVTTATVSSVDFGNYWRVSATFVAGATGNFDIVLLPAFNSTGDGVLVLTATGSAVFYGHQLEVGSFPTSYIPTTTAALTRSADVCSITGGDFTSFYNQSEGTLFVEASGIMNSALGSNRPFVAISNGTYNNTFTVYKNSGSALIGTELRSGGFTGFERFFGYTQFVAFKIAVAAKLNNANSSFNGAIGSDDTLVTMPTVDRLAFRDATANSAGQASCHIARIQYFKKRLPNAKLQSLTAP